MKVSVSFFILGLLLMPWFLIGQVFPTPELNPKWSLQGLPGGDLVSEDLWVDSLGVEIDGNTWYPVNSTREFSIFSGEPTRTTSIGSYRVDGEKVYFKGPFSEGLLYDFSANVGDTLDILSPGGSNTETISHRVVEIDSVTCNLETRKRMFLEFDQFGRTYYVLWIEGVGDVYHPFLPGACSSITCSIIYAGGELEVEETVIVLESIMTCNTLSGRSVSNHRKAISIFPNPIEGTTFTLEFDEAKYGPYMSVVLFNSYGQIVFQDEVNSLEPINTIDFKTGIYFLSTTSKYGTRASFRIFKK